MKKRIIFLLIAVLAVSFSSTGSTAPKFLKKAKEKITNKEEKKKEEKKKEAAKPVSTVNPLSGKWSFFSQNQFFEITFSSDTAIFNVRNAETYKSEKVEMKYKFSNSPIILEHKTPDGKTIKLSMKYTVKGDKLIYRFLNTKNKSIPGLYEDFSMTRASRTAEPKDADIVLEKQGGSSEETSVVEEEKSEVISVKPAETKKDDKKSADVVLVKGLQLKVCREDLNDPGFITVPGLKNILDGEYDAAHAMKNSIKIPVKNGKFDLTLPSNPVFGAEVESNEAVYEQKINDFGTAKVYYFQLLDFKNSRKPSEASHGRDVPAEGRVFIGFYLYYSEADVTGTINGDAVTLKKGWNIIGDKTDLSASLDCRQQ